MYPLANNCEQIEISRMNDINRKTRDGYMIKIYSKCKFVKRTRILISEKNFTSPDWPHMDLTCRLR